MPDLSSLSLRNFESDILIKSGKIEINIFEMRAEFFFEEIKAKWDECRRRILLGDNTCGRAVILRSIRFWCVGVLISTRLHFI